MVAGEAKRRVRVKKRVAVVKVVKRRSSHHESQEIRLIDLVITGRRMLSLKVGVKAVEEEEEDGDEDLAYRGERERKQEGADEGEGA